MSQSVPAMRGIPDGETAGGVDAGYIKRMRVVLEKDGEILKICCICMTTKSKRFFPLLVHMNGTGCRPACQECAKGKGGGKYKCPRTGGGLIIERIIPMHA